MKKYSLSVIIKSILIKQVVHFMENKEENKKKKSEKYTSDKLIYIIVIAGLLIDIYFTLQEIHL